jgi:small conductance mechanosensitive channel
MEHYLTPDFWLALMQSSMRLLVIFAAAWASLHICHILIHRFFFGKTTAGRLPFDEKRAKTLSSLLESICKYALYFVVIVMVLQEIKVDTTSILASAGVIGLAVGVGAQNVVKDFIAGFFIILEDQYAVGDYIISGTNEGTVEELGFRVTKLRDANGVLHVLPNGGITRVSNFNRGNIQTSVNIPVSYRTSAKDIVERLQAICNTFSQDRKDLVEGPTVMGIVEFQPAYMVIRILMKTVPLTQARLEAELRLWIREEFGRQDVIDLAPELPDSRQGDGFGPKSEVRTEKTEADA